MAEVLGGAGAASQMEGKAAMYDSAEEEDGEGREERNQKEEDDAFDAEEFSIDVLMDKVTGGIRFIHLCCCCCCCCLAADDDDDEVFVDFTSI
jgi:hypothetical protein